MLTVDWKERPWMAPKATNLQPLVPPLDRAQNSASDVLLAIILAALSPCFLSRDILEKWCLYGILVVHPSQPLVEVRWGVKKTSSIGLDSGV